MTYVRHATAPAPDGCRWDGIPEREHARRWTASKRWHAWTAPTDAQRLARMRARRGLATAGERS